MLAGYAWFWRKLMRLGVIVNMGPGGVYSREIGRQTAEAFMSYGGNVVRVEELHPDKDLDAALRDLLAAAPQGIVIPEETMLAAKIAKRLRELGFRVSSSAPTPGMKSNSSTTAGIARGRLLYRFLFAGLQEQRGADVPGELPEDVPLRARQLRSPGLRRHEAPGDRPRKRGDAGAVQEEPRHHPQLSRRGGDLHHAPGRLGVDRTIHINTIRPADPGNPEPAARLNRSFMTSQIDRLDN